MTPNNHDDLSTDLGRALHDRADGLVGSPLTLSDVKGRATRIRRRRAIAASAAAAAAVAIIVPTAIVGSDMFDSSTGPDPANPSPNPTETDGGSQSWPQRLDPSDLPLGEAPQIIWREGSTTWHTPDGEVALPADYSQVVPYDDGWLAWDPAAGQAVRLDREGSVLGQSATSSGFAVSSDGSQVLWVDLGALTIHDSTSGEDTVIGSGFAGTDPIAIEDDVAYFNVGTDDYQLDGRWWRDGEVHDPVPGKPQPYTDVSVDGLTAQISSVTLDGSCSTVRSADGNSLGETCGFTLDGFAPDGQHLLAGPSYRDGFGDGELAVLPAEASALENDEVVLHYQRKGDTDPFFLSSRWEDDSHILALTFTPSGISDKGTWQILRIGLDGSIENAVEPVEDVDLPEVAPFGLP